MKVTKEFMLLLTNGAAQKKSKPSSSSSASEDKNAPGQKLADTLRKVLEKAGVAAGGRQRHSLNYKVHWYIGVWTRIRGAASASIQHGQLPAMWW